MAIVFAQDLSAVFSGAIGVREMDLLMPIVIGTIGMIVVFFIGAITGVTATVKAIGPTLQVFEEKINRVLNASKEANKIIQTVSDDARFARATSMAAHMYIEALDRNLPGVRDALENLRFHVQREREFEGGL